MLTPYFFINIYLGAAEKAARPVGVGQKNTSEHLLMMQNVIFNTRNIILLLLFREAFVLMAFTAVKPWPGFSSVS